MYTNTYLHSTILLLYYNYKQYYKEDKLSYWLEDWTSVLDFETIFNPKSLRRYERGEIVKVHLGFNVGSEEGGLHYAVVVEKDNAKSSPVVTIVPLTSVKPHTDINKLKSGSIYLGNELFTNLSSKVKTYRQEMINEVFTLNHIIQNIDSATSSETLNEIQEKLDICENDINLAEKMHKEIQNMKIGSIALVNQITTISKIRIYDPKTDHDVLSNIKLSNEKLDMIDNEIIHKFTK